MNTVTRADLALAVRRAVPVPVSPIESAVLVIQVLDEITRALVSGENVKLNGFATFWLSDKGERPGRNFATGVEVKIPPHRVVTFFASPVFVAKIDRRRTDNAPISDAALDERQLHLQSC